jgi:hypothetical protein
VLVVANKSDRDVVRQDYILQPEAFCAKHKVGLLCQIQFDPNTFPRSHIQFLVPVLSFLEKKFEMNFGRLITCDVH